MPLMKYERGQAAIAAPEPESKQPCAPGVLQLRQRTLYLA